MKERQKNDGNDYSADIYSYRACGQSSNLASQQEMGLLSHQRRERDYSDNPGISLDRPLGAQALVLSWMPTFWFLMVRVLILLFLAPRLTIGINFSPKLIYGYVDFLPFDLALRFALPSLFFEKNESRAWASTLLSVSAYSGNGNSGQGQSWGWPLN
jgi:hypothetical protein